MSSVRGTRLFAALLACAAVLIPARAMAQNVTFGVKGGINIANVNFDLEGFDANPDTRMGGIGGVFVAKDFSEKAGIVIEGLFSQKGTKLSFSDSGFNIEDSVRVNFIEIPVLARVNMPAGGSSVFHVFGGPAFAFKVSDSEDVKVDGVDQPSDEETGIKSTDVGIAVGAGIDIGNFLIDGRYTFGLVNLNDSTDAGEPVVKTRTISIMVGFKFGK